MRHTTTKQCQFRVGIWRYSSYFDMSTQVVAAKNDRIMRSSNYNLYEKRFCFTEKWLSLTSIKHFPKNTQRMYLSSLTSVVLTSTLKVWPAYTLHLQAFMSPSGNFRGTKSGLNTRWVFSDLNLEEVSLHKSL